jgi:RNA polymerase sigma-70 factor, ECF subfamily
MMCLADRKPGGDGKGGRQRDGTGPAAAASPLLEKAMPDRTALIEPYIPGLRRFARALLRGDADRADDLVQDALERALSRWHTRRSAGDIRGWLYTILFNRFRSDRDRLRRRGIHHDLSLISEMQLPRIEGEQEATLRHRDLLLGFAQLPEEQRSVLFLIGVEDLSYEEAARVLGLPTGTVMSRLSRGRERLRQHMNGDRQLRSPELRRIEWQRVPGRWAKRSSRPGLTVD